MGDKIVVGPINGGLRKDREAFVIDNDSFPVLINAYQWRGRIKRKRGTTFLCHLQRYFDSTSLSYTDGPATITLDGTGAGNLISGFGLESDASIVPGTVEITIGATTYTDPTQDGYLTPTGTGGPNTINYATGAILIPAEAGNAASLTMSYYPNLPVMGIEELNLDSTQYSKTISFDTTYAYNISTASPNLSNDVSFYKNPPINSDWPNYVPKTVWTKVRWNGENYRQFWSVNYQNALWVTNGLNVPFDASKYGMQFQKVNGGAQVWVNATTMTFNIDNCPLVIGDFVFANEFTAVGGAANAATLNLLTGYVTNVIDLGVTSVVTVEFPSANIANDSYSDGLLQYLTNNSDETKDCIRWYDGDPTNGNSTNPVFAQGKGWVNFCPPLSRLNYIISDLPEAQYYLVGAKMIVNFKDRLLFLGPIVQTSANGASPIYLQDTIVYSQNGTPYYTATFDEDPTLATTTFLGVLLPENQTATVSSFWSDETGFGGFIQAGLQQQIMTCNSNEDVLIIGFSVYQTRLAYTGNDIIPFAFYLINNEFGSSSTFSSITLDKGVLTRGNRGYLITSQTECRRFDLEVPDQVFETKLTDNGTDRVCSQRDYINEWIYFTYPSNQQSYIFPNQTFMYNYRDDSWSVINECYTTYGTFQRSTGYTWNTIGSIYPSWSIWNDPWNAGTTTLLTPQLVGGNQQGYILERDNGTGEGKSLEIQSFNGSEVTCINHCLNEGNFIVINDCLGTIGAQVNGKIFSVNLDVSDKTNTFKLNPNIETGTYFGLGNITRMYVPFIQTKQFPVAWQYARKIRLGPQQYLLSYTENGQIQLLIFLSQNNDSPYNTGELVPNVSINNSLIYSTVLYTCPESTNLGLTPANINLQMVTASRQNQIWHRKNTSLIGDTVQIGFTISDSQMRSFIPTIQTFDITAISQSYPCVIDCVNNISAGVMVYVTGVEGMEEINYQGNQETIYQVIDSTSTTITLNLDSSAFTAYDTGGVVSVLTMPNQFEEVELHSFILDVSPSMLLA